MTRTPAITRTITPVVESTLTPSTSSVPDVATTNDPSVVYESCTEEPSIVSIIPDAMMSPKLLFVDTFSAGKAQSIGDSRSGERRQFGRYDDVFGNIDYFSTGGRDGGGYIKATTDSILRVNIASSSGGRYYIGTDETPPTQGGIISIHNLFGVLITQPTVLQSVGLQVDIEVMPDYTLRPNSNGEFGIRTAYKVPANGWFALETEAGIAPALLTSGGFANTNLYIPGGPTIGIPIIRASGYNTRTVEDIIELYLIYIPANTGLCAVAINGPYGATKRWMYDLIFANAWPSASGDKTESIVNYSHHEHWGNTLDDTPINFGTDLHWGDVNRWKNVIRTDHSAYAGDESLTTVSSAGELSIFTDRWLSGPFYPDIDPVVRNTFVDGATDLYTIKLDKTNVGEIEAIGTFALAGARSWRAQAGGFLFPTMWWNFCGPHPYVPGHPLDFGWPLDYVQSGAIYGSCNAAYEQIIKTSTGDIVTTRKAIAMNNAEWRSELGYTRGPDLMLDKDPATNKKWNPKKLPQIGVRTTYEFLDAIHASVDNRWVQVDIAQIGFDVAYRTKSLNLLPPAIQAPIAAFKTSGFNNLTGVLSVYDISVDFNGDTSTLVSGIVSRIMDWGDGSPTQNLPVGVVGGIATGTVFHTYDANGSTYTAKLTVINSHGLRNIVTKNFVTIIGAITASFSVGIDSGDVLGFTIDCTDSSAVVGGSVTGWHWDFGDGHTSNLQNPVHVYTSYGTYNVSLTVTGNHGQTNTTIQTITLVLPVIGGDCKLLDDATVNLPFVQGDPFDGRNPPLTAYLNTASFDVFYRETTFREFYWDNYDAGTGSGAAHSIDTINKFNGHPGLKMWFGVDGFGTHQFGAGWFTFLTDDAATEVEYRSLSQWFGVILNGDPTLVSQVLTDADEFSGLEIFTFGNQFYFGLYVRNNKLFLDIQYRDTAITQITTHVQLALDSAILNLTNKCVLSRCDFDETAHTARIRIWLGDACSLTGISPIYDHTYPAFSGLSESGLSWFNCLFNVSGTLKYLTIYDVFTLPTSISNNPCGVALT